MILPVITKLTNLKVIIVLQLMNYLACAWQQLAILSNTLVLRLYEVVFIDVLAVSGGRVPPFGFDPLLDD